MGLLIIVLVELTGLIFPTLLWFLTSLSSVGFSWWSYTEKMMLVDPANPIFITGATLLTAGALRYIRNEEERRGVRNAFGQYLAPELVEVIAKNPKELQLGGSKTANRDVYGYQRFFYQYFGRAIPDTPTSYPSYQSVSDNHVRFDL